MATSPNATVARRPSLVTRARVSLNSPVCVRFGRFAGESKNVFHGLMPGGRPAGATRVPTVIVTSGCMLPIHGWPERSPGPSARMARMSGRSGSSENLSQPVTRSAIGHITNNSWSTSCTRTPHVAE